MGGNTSSTVKLDSKAYISPTNNSDIYINSSSTIDIEIEGGPDYYYIPQINSNNSIRSKSPPSAALVPSSKAGKLQRLIHFRSSPSCRGYLEASKASNNLIVIGFTNGWCACCRNMDPTLHEFAAKYSDAEFLKINVDELHGVAWEYRVQTTPTFLFMKKGKVIDKFGGATKQQLQNTIEKYIYIT